MKNQWLTIRQLDKQFHEWQALKKSYGNPRMGWIKTVRTALGMTAEQLAKRLGLTRSRVNQLEKGELRDAVTLRALREAADGLGCELIYAIVPKVNSTLESIIKKRAEEIATERVARVAHSMSLEAQSVDAETLKLQKDELVKDLVDHLNKKFWNDVSEGNSLAELIANLKKIK